ncbi:MAG: hypothetical protein U0075_19700 [Thermomicrobiales bacterium]
MRYSRMLVLLFVFVSLGMGALASQPAGAQEATPAAMSGHPLVGAWVLDGDVNDPANPPELIVFTADGLYIGSDAFGGNTVGVWEPTGARTGAITLAFPATGGALPGGMVHVRGTVEVAEDGQSFTAIYSLEVATPDGALTGEYGPGAAAGTRMVIEPMGEPRGPLAELFGPMQATPSS